MTKKRTLKQKTKGKESKLRLLMYNLLAFVMKITGLLVSLLVLFLAAIYIGAFGPLPSTNTLSGIQNNLASEVYAMDGTLMGKYYRENRMSVENKHISEHVIHALVATEDARFFEHGGYDPISLGRVLLRTVILRDSRQGGGSTINQQLAKNLYPRQSFGVLSLPVNKVKEIYIAARLEKVYTKEEILALYLNTVPFGESVYGIESAALRFFDKHAADLEAPEAAVLVGMLAANTAYNPRLHPDLSMKRRNIVLKRMLEQGFIEQDQAQKYIAQPIALHYHKLDHNNGIAPYFRSYLKQKVEHILDEKYGDYYNLYTDGLKIYTTIDPVMQHYAQEAVLQHMSALQKTFKAHWLGRIPWQGSPEVFERELKRSQAYKRLKAEGKTEEDILEEMAQLKAMSIFAYPQERQVHLSSLDSISHYLKILNTGFLVMEPHSGAIRSWIGGVSHRYFKYDHVRSQRQVGSTFKPIVYAAALKNGMSPCQYFSNERRVYQNYDDWSPSNSDANYQGYYSMKGALTNSVNTVTAEVMMQTGVDKVLNLAEAMGIKSKLPAVPSLSLGVGEISLQEMLTAYSCFANQGYKTEAVALLRIEDRSGKVLYESDLEATTRPVFDQEIARMMNVMLEGVVEEGTGKALRSRYHLKSNIAGKTGTTQNNADGWFIGYNPKLLAGVWVGADHPQVHFRTTTLGQGAYMALPIYGLFMQKLEADPRYRKYTEAQFDTLTNALAETMDCPNFVLEDPEKGAFDFLKFKRDKETDNQIKESDNQKETRRERRRRLRKERGGLFKRKN